MAPNATWSQPFNAGAGTGLGSYLIGDFAMTGDIATGNLVLLYDVHSIDPTSVGDDTVSGYRTALAATVTNRAAAETPEPAGALTALIGLAILGLGKLARRHK